jgi:hypothetical protein
MRPVEIVVETQTQRFRGSKEPIPHAELYIIFLLDRWVPFRWVTLNNFEGGRLRKLGILDGTGERGRDVVVRKSFRTRR